MQRLTLQLLGTGKQRLTKLSTLGFTYFRLETLCSEKKLHTNKYLENLNLICFMHSCYLELRILTGKKHTQVKLQRLRKA